jgi:hypothetical protein
MDIFKAIVVLALVVFCIMALSVWYAFEVKCASNKDRIVNDFLKERGRLPNDNKELLEYAEAKGELLLID